MKSLVLGSLLVLAPVAAGAQQAIPTIPPSLQNHPLVKSILDAVGGLLQTTDGNAAHGRVTYFRRFDLQVETAPNVYREIHLHQGTIINPRGTTIAPGQFVDVSGATQPDRSLNADEITVH